jgi:hypothetical protein
MIIAVIAAGWRLGSGMVCFAALFRRQLMTQRRARGQGLGGRPHLQPWGHPRLSDNALPCRALQ